MWGVYETNIVNPVPDGAPVPPWPPEPHAWMEPSLASAANAESVEKMAVKPPPDGAPRSRKSARIISKVNRGAMVTSYRHLSSGRHMNSGGKHHHGHGKSRKSLIAGMKQSGVHHSVAALSTVNPDLAPMKDAELKLVRNTKEMSLIDRSGLHKLPEAAPRQRGKRPAS